MTPDTLVLNAQTCDNILGMINSVDQENKVVALSCIDNVDFSENLTFILILKKEGQATSAEWTEHAPSTTKMLKSIGVNMDTTLTFKKVLEILVERKVPRDHIQFYLDKFTVHLFQSIKNLGYEFVDKLEINIKLKTSDGEQTGSISESIKGPHA